MKSPEDSSLAEAWFSKGDNDLKNAEIVLKAQDPPTDTVCFHCQQVAEKYLKGFLAHHGVAFFKQHDLIYLLDLCIEKDSTFGELEEAMNALNDYAVEARYPFEEEIVYLIEEAEAALEFAKKVRMTVREKLDLD